MAAASPNHLKYTKEHEWVLEENNGQAVVGVTQYALDQLGDVVYLELPKVGTVFQAGTVFGTIESTKTVSDLYMPVTGTVVAVNDAAVQEPESIVKDPYGAGWLVKLEEVTLPSDLMDAAAYDAYVS